ncbi:MAG: PAS domain-containing sensor histidine kinase [Actinomycetota bacterium]
MNDSTPPEPPGDAEARYRALVEQLPAVTYLDEVEPSDRTLYMSPQVEALLGYTPEEMTREVPLWPQIIHPDDRERVLAESKRHDETGDPYDTEYRLIARDGRTVWIHDRSVLVRGEDGKPHFWQGVLVEITERKRTQELERALEVQLEEAAELRALDEMKNTFLRAVSHDLRTPLAAILGLAVTLEREDLQLDAAETKQMAGRIVVNARKLDRLVNDLLDIDRIGRGMVEPSLVETELDRLVREVVTGSDLIPGREVVIETEPVVVNVDPSKVERIVENLLANTARHTPPGSGVWVSVRPEEHGVVIAVEDDGPGVPPEHRIEIFEPFQQGPGTPDHSPGVGIGLALVARFAELHGGHAWVEDREGGGASFRVYLPEAPPLETLRD